MITKKVQVAILTLTIGLFVSLETKAQDSNGRGERKERPTIEELFTQMDENEDGKLSLKETEGPIKKDFTKIDANEDGFLTKEELENAPKPKKRKRPQ